MASTAQKTTKKTTAKTSTKTVADTAGGSLLDRIRGSKVAPATILLIARSLTLALVAVFDYILVTVVAVQGVPTIMAFVQNGSGVTMDMPLEVVLGVWILPALVFIGALFALMLTIFRAAWRLRKKLLTKLSSALSGADTAAA